MTNVLIVDDNPLDRKLAEGFVRRIGLETTFAENGRDAMKILRKQPSCVDIVLTDLDMPEIDGLELVKEAGVEFPSIPVVLLTAHGSEDIAIEALKRGASSYVAKRRFGSDLESTLRQTLALVMSANSRQLVAQYLDATESRFTIDYEDKSRIAITSYLQDLLRSMKICSDTDLLRVSTAFSEALLNALEHGNLELDSSLREIEHGAPFRRLAAERKEQPPYRDRRVRIAIKLTNHDVEIKVADEGPGFDPSKVPDPTKPENLMLCHGRGLVLMQTFMDKVGFNAIGNEITLCYYKRERTSNGK